jgi:hypothetical protein
VVQTFRKELSDLRQRDIERLLARTARSTTRRSGRHRLSGALASALHRLADRLESMHDVPAGTRGVVIRQP